MKELQSVAASNVVVVVWIADDRYTPHYGYPTIWRPAAIIRLPGHCPALNLPGGRIPKK